MSLAVHLHGSRIGTLRRGTGTDYAFEYAPEVVAEAGEGAVVLSHSLPVRGGPYGAIETRTFFEGLLPESSRRDELGRELRIDANDTYALLGAIGRDCAGAIVIVPDETDPALTSGEIEWLDDEELATLVDELPRRPLGIQRRGGKLRLSLAGVQRKLVLIRSGSGRFGLPTADTPSTHLLKPEYEHEYPGLAHNEMFCMSVARCIGLPAAETELGRELAPLYDIVSTAVYDLEDEMAMAIGDTFDPESVRLADWLDMSADCDLAPTPFLAAVRRAAANVRECAHSVAALARAQGWHIPLIDEILAVADRRASLIESELGP